MSGNMDALTVTKYVYKSAVISGTTMICNDLTSDNRVGSPLARALRNLASLAGGYCFGKRIADKSWQYIEEAIERYMEG